jgi:hypothetical protein
LSFATGYTTVFNQTVTSRLPKIFGERDQKIEALDAAVHKIVEHVVKEIGIKDPYAVSLTSDVGIIDLKIPSEYRGNADAFLAVELRKVNRTAPVIATASVGVYTFKRSWFFPRRQESTFIIEVYPNDRSTGHRFCQMVRFDKGGVLERYRGLIYLGKIPNIFVSSESAPIASASSQS